MKYLLFLLLTITTLAARSQTITPEAAKDSIGKQVTVCGTVTGTHTVDASGVTFLNMGGKYPNNAFTVVILKDDAAKFSYPLSTLSGKNICITGLVKDYKGKPEIVATEEKQILVKQPATPLQSTRE